MITSASLGLGQSTKIGPFSLIGSNGTPLFLFVRGPVPAGSAPCSFGSGFFSAGGEGTGTTAPAAGGFGVAASSGLIWMTSSDFCAGCVRKDRPGGFSARVTGSGGATGCGGASGRLVTAAARDREGDCRGRKSLTAASGLAGSSLDWFSLGRFNALSRVNLGRLRSLGRGIDWPGIALGTGRLGRHSVRHRTDPTDGLPKVGARSRLAWFPTAGSGDKSA